MKFKNLFILFTIINQKKFLSDQLKKISFFSFIQPLIELGIILLIIPFITNFIKKNETLYFERLITIINPDIKNNVFIQIVIALIILIILYLLLIFVEKKIIKICFDFFSKTKTYTLKFILNQNFKYLFNTDVANQVQVVSNEINVLVQASLSFANIIKAISLFLTFSLVLLYLNPKITIIIIFVLATINLILFVSFKKKFSDYGKQDIKASLKSNSIIFNIISNIFSIKQYSIENDALNISRNSFDILQKIRSEYLFSQKLIKFLLEIIIFSSLLIFLILFSKSKLFFDENLAFLSILIYGIFRLFPLLSQFNTNFGSLVKLEKGSETIKKSLQNLSQDQTKDIEFNISDIKKNELIIKNYSITINNKKLIEDSNLYLNQGKIYFLIGANGSGKSSFLKSLLHVNDYEGEIFYGDVELKKININKLFKITKYCPQNDIIFDDTIAFNIILNNEEIKNTEYFNKVIDACELSDFVKDRNIYEYGVGENGYKISGGEKQKILLARALYSKPNFLYLDESFSNISNSDTVKIFKKLEKILPKSLIIIITHQMPQMDNLNLLKIENKKIEKN